MNENKYAEKNQVLKDINQEKKNFFLKVRKYFYKKYKIWDLFDLFPYNWRMCYYDHIKPLFFPCHKKIRRAVSKNWSDIATLIQSVNFQMIKSFYEDEYSNDIVDWEATEQHKTFSNWLEKAYKYIVEVRPQLETSLINAYPPSKPLDEMFKIVEHNGKKMYEMIDDGIPYEKKYSEVIHLENLIDDNDTEILIQMIKFRKFFWT